MERHQKLLICNGCGKEICRKGEPTEIQKCGHAKEMMQTICSCKEECYFSFDMTRHGNTVVLAFDFCRACQSKLLKHMLGVSKDGHMDRDAFFKMKEFFNGLRDGNQKFSRPVPLIDEER